MDAAAINSMAAKIRSMSAIMEKSLSIGSRSESVTELRYHYSSVPSHHTAGCAGRNGESSEFAPRTQRAVGGSTVPPAILLHVPFGT